MSAGRARRAAVLALLVAVGCTGGGDHVESPTGPPECEARLAVPPGFRVVESFRDPYPDHVGVRLGFRDDKGREIHYLVGIPGEFGEGLPLVGPVAVASGGPARLLGRGRTWVLAWSETGPCAAHAVLGHGFGKAEFEHVLEDAGVTPASG
ncbi:MAG TPA: hypothetical protein VFC04_00265 [Actinomycetota bacterium]|nr:hypothetical protein [Actinomycetota bacterium]